jgi:signal transduction histidine kinase
MKRERKRLLPALAVAIVFIAANAFVSFWSVRTIAESSRRVIRSQNIIEQVISTLSAIKSAETSQRGYLLTGDGVFLDRFRQHVAETRDHLETLDSLVADDAVESERAAELRLAFEERNKTLEGNIAIRRDRGLDGLVQAGTLYLGKSQMDHVLDLIAQVQADEHRRLELRTAELAQSSRDITIAIIGANILGLGLLGSAYYLVNRYVDERDRSEERLRKAHDELEDRVRERTSELNDANIELERSNRELQDFAFVASHDLQEPLRKIQAFGDRLKSKYGNELTDEGQDYLARMQNAAQRMHRLINDLLTFSRVATKAQPFVEIDLNEIAKDVLDDMETSLQESGATVETGHLPTIEADPLQMRQLFQNLIGNALKFHRRDVAPIVKINGEPLSGEKNGEAATYRITVEDNGIGFDEKYLDRIFTPFQRLHGRGEYEGTGIGLAVCRKIVERHGGTLTASSREGSGSTFVVTLPIKQDR